MKDQAAIKNRAAKWTRHFAHACGWLAAVVLFGSVMQAADAPPKNVFTWPPVLPPDLRRVALLPMAAEGPDANLPDGCEALQPVLFDELVRTEKFEVVSVRPENLRASSGRAAWTGAEQLPKEFLDSLRREYGCDAVLFCELTVYHPYAPLAIGWRLKLADARTHEIIWAADEVFDASKTGVSKQAWQFLLNRAPSEKKQEIRWRSENSPRQFGSYAAAEILRGLPAR
jgi:hypothetical protein